MIFIKRDRLTSIRTVLVNLARQNVRIDVAIGLRDDARVPCRDDVTLCVVDKFLAQSGILD